MIATNAIASKEVQTDTCTEPTITCKEVGTQTDSIDISIPISSTANVKPAINESGCMNEAEDAISSDDGKLYEIIA